MIWDKYLIKEGEVTGKRADKGRITTEWTFFIHTHTHNIILSIVTFMVVHMSPILSQLSEFSSTSFTHPF